MNEIVCFSCDRDVQVSEFAFLYNRGVPVSDREAEERAGEGGASVRREPAETTGEETCIPGR